MPNVKSNQNNKMTFLQKRRKTEYGLVKIYNTIHTMKYYDSITGKSKNELRKNIRRNFKSKFFISCTFCCTIHSIVKIKKSMKKIFGFFSSASK